MPKISIPRILRPLEFGDYAQELDGMVLQVWVNPPRKLVARYHEIQQEISRLKDKMAELVELAKSDGMGTDLSAEVDTLEQSIDAMNADLFGWFAEVWSQGGQQETPETVKAFALENIDTDPALWSFVTSRTVGMIRDHREGARKN